MRRLKRLRERDKPVDLWDRDMFVLRDYVMLVVIDCNV